MQFLKIYQGLVLVIVLIMNSMVLGETAEEWIYRGYDAGSSDKAIEYYTKAISIDPNHKFAYARRGLVKVERGDIEGAIEDFTKAIEISPRFVDAYVARGKAKKAKGDLEGAQQDFLRAEQERKKGDYRLEDLNAAILADPNNVKLYWSRANYKDHKGDYAGAIIDYDKYIKLIGKPNNDLAYWYRALAKEKIEDFEGAMTDYTLMIKQFPDNESAYRKRAEFKRQLGDIEGAKADELEAENIYRQKMVVEIQKLSQALEKAPSNRYLLERLVSKRMKIKDYAGAIADLDKAIERKPSVYLFEQRAEVKKNSGHLMGAITDLDLAIELEPSSYLFELRAKIKKAKGDLKGYQEDEQKSEQLWRVGRIQSLTQTLEKNPSDREALIERAQLWMESEKYSKALEDINQAIEIKSRAFLFYRRAKAKKASGDLKGYQTDEKKAARLKKQEEIQSLTQDIARNPFNVTALLERAKYQIALEEYSNALKDLAKVMEIDPRFNDEVYFLRAQAKKKMGDLKGYEEDYALYKQIRDSQKFEE